MRVKIKGKVYDCVGVAALASMCNYSPKTLRKLETLGVLPTANIKIEANAPIPGKQRLYTMELAEEVAVIFREENLRPPQKRDPKVIIALKQAFQREAERLNNPESHAQ